ncbi:MAG: PqqD family protein [Bacteroidales bacterium]|jgi:hypothetical protein|nr:PqqD family protein [Bacteroidales bacterium]
MRTKEGFVLRKLLGEHILAGEGLQQINFNRIISLNDSAAWLWEQVEGKEFTADDLKNLLLEKYDVEESVAEKDAKALAESWLNAGVVEE